MEGLASLLTALLNANFIMLRHSIVRNVLEVQTCTREKLSIEMSDKYTGQLGDDGRPIPFVDRIALLSCDLDGGRQWRSTVFIAQVL